MKKLDDQRLLKAVAQGDTAAFEQLYRTYKDDLLTAADILLAGDRSSAEDVLHDVFVSFARRAKTLELKNNLRNYLLTSCLNRARDLLKQRGRESLTVSKLTEHPTLTSNPAISVVIADEIQQLTEVLRLLPVEQREVITLHIHGQLKFREIADMLGISINTAQSRYRYALAALRKMLSKNEVTNED